MAQELNAKGQITNDPRLVYIKDEVDAVLAEKDAEIRRLKRALWLVRAYRARDKAFEYHFKNNVEMCAKWDNVHLILMAKAEEYR